MNLIVNKLFLQITVAAWCTGLALVAQAAGLGAINVQSALGQPLSAEIVITSLASDEFDEIKARIASADAYDDAKVRYLSIVRQIRVAAERRADGRAILKLSSNAPINEPVLELLVEFTWRSGQLVQKYSILLDPAK